MGARVAAFGLLFDAVDSVQSFVDVFIYVYVLVIFVYVLTSWIPLPYSPALSRVQRFLYDVCNPYLRLFRRVLPRSFNDAQQIADKFKDGIPVILNLQGADGELSKRLIDFASGLTYALDGGMQRVADKVFLLTPRNVEVSAEERARILERGGFFNQA